MTKCKVCGAGLADDVTICPICNADLTVSDNDSSDPGEENITEESNESTESTDTSADHGDTIHIEETESVESAEKTESTEPTMSADETEKEIERLLKRGDECFSSGRAWLGAKDRSRARKEFQRAYNYYNTVLKLDPDNQPARDARAKCLFKMA